MLYAKALIRSAALGLLSLVLSPSCWSQSNYATPYYFTTLAGRPFAGSSDGTASAAQFNQPEGIAVDGAGNIYVADSFNNVIRRITPAGVVTTLAGSSLVSGATDGAGSEARFNWPRGVAVDDAGNVYVADASNATIRRITPAGIVATLAGSAGHTGFLDGAGSGARLYLPTGVAVDAAGNLYVADDLNAAIRIITPAGVVSTLTGTGLGYANSFFPQMIAVDGTGNLDVLDAFGSVLKITPAKAVTVVFAPVFDHTQPRYGLNATGMTADAAGNVYLNLGYFGNTSPTYLSRINPDGTESVLADTPPGSENVAVDNAGNVYLANPADNTIQKISTAGVSTTLAGARGGSGSTDAAGGAARFNGPKGVAVDRTGNVYVADTGNNTIRKITADGLVTTLAGGGGQFQLPAGVAVEGTGSIYVADSGNHVIRKVTPGGVVSLFAGDPSLAGSADGPATAAQFHDPIGIAVDTVGNVYVSDQADYTIRKITPGGAVTTLAGSAGNNGSADGAGATARFGYPFGLAVDDSGNVYVADTGNSTIRKITPAGVVTTLAGMAGVPGSADGTGSAARFRPGGIAVDGAGNLYVADSWNQTVRMITAAGVVTTLAGMVPPFVGTPSSDGLGSSARFGRYPSGIAVDRTGKVYVADTGNHTIRMGQLAGPPVITAQPQSQTVMPGTGVQFSVTAGGVPGPGYQWFFNGSPVAGATTNTLNVPSARASDAGDYTVVVTNPLGGVTSGKATLTISAGSGTEPPPSTPGGAGGGGSIEAWFILAGFSLAAARRLAGIRGR